MTAEREERMQDEDVQFLLGLIVIVIIIIGLLVCAGPVIFQYLAFDTPPSGADMSMLMLCGATGLLVSLFGFNTVFAAVPIAVGRFTYRLIVKFRRK